MASTPHQPILPAEQPPSRAEKFFIEVQPSIFPPNQDSNWGLKRKIWTDQVEELIDQQDSIWRERFVATSLDFLDEWEHMVGIPINPPSTTTEGRRQRILARLRTGPFTDSRRTIIIEPYLAATFGVSVELTPSGVSLVGGIPLMADAAGDPRQYYRIYEDVRNFAYTVYIRSDVTPDIPSLTRDLKRITPAGITVTINNSLLNILNYTSQVLNEQPIAYWHLDGTLNNVSGYGSLNLTDPGTTHTPATVASPGLLDSHVTSSNGARDFDGVDDYLGVPSLATYTFPQMSIEAIVTIDSKPATSAYKMAVTLAPQCYVAIAKDNSGNDQWVVSWTVNGTQSQGRFYPGGVVGASIALGGPYHIVATHNGHHFEFIVNGISQGTFYSPGTLVSPAGSAYIGSWTSGGGTPYWWDGKIDEVAIYNDALTVDQARLHYHTANNDWNY